MKVLFTEGKDGRLAGINPDGKYHFPNRGSKITEPGLYECNVIKDFSTYAFVDGDLIQTKLPSDKVLYDALCKNESELSIRRIGLSFILVIKSLSTGTIKICYCTENDEEKIFTDDNYLCHIREASFLRICDSIYKYKPIRIIDRIVDIICECSDEINPVSLIEIVSAAFCEIGAQRRFKLIDGIRIYKNKIIMVQSHWDNRIFDETYSDFDTFFLNNDKIVALNDNYISPKFEFIYNQGTDVNITDLKSFMINSHIGFPMQKGLNDIVCENEIKAADSNITIKFLNALHYAEATDDDKKEVEESFQQLYALRKRIGKSCSKEAIQILKELTDAKVLNIMF